MKSIAFVGNPNVGKTSLFNRLTKSSEHVGNWHGVTNSAKEKGFEFKGKRLFLTDLPGLYSLSVYSPEEAVTRDAVLTREHDVVVNVCEGDNIFRNLYLTLQLLEANVPTILAINMIDELEKKGKRIDVEKIEKVLGIPVVCVSAKSKKSSLELITLVLECLNPVGASTCRPLFVSEYGNGRQVAAPTIFLKSLRKETLKYLSKLPLNEIISIIRDNAKKHNIDEIFAAIKVMEQDEFILEKLQLTNYQKKQIEKFDDLSEKVASARYAFIDEELRKVILDKNSAPCQGDRHADCGKGLPQSLRGTYGVIEPVTLTHAKNIGNRSGRQSAASASGDEKQSGSKSSHSLFASLKKSKLSFFDKIVLNRYLAIPIFLLLMLGVFYVTFGVVGGGLSSGLSFLITRFLYTPIKSALEGANTPVWMIGLICDGVILGVGGVLVFLPQIALLFFFLALLEDTGYMSRVAFMMDGLFSRIGLSGRSCFTLLMGFGCTASAVTTARSIDDEGVRKKTALLTPLMSCSAKLPTFLVLAAAFFANGSPLIVFGMYFLGAFFMIVIALIFEKTAKRLKSSKKSFILKEQGIHNTLKSFIMELPPYRVPTIERVFQVVFTHSKHFIVRVATVVFALNIIMWVLSNFSFSHGYITGTQYASIFETFTSLIAPIFAPLGFGEWRAVTALLSGIVAKEASLAALESLGGVQSVFAGEYSALSALSFMVFTLLYIPCLASCVSIRKEVGGKLMAFSVLFHFVLAYIVSLIVFQMGRLLINYPWIFIMIIAAIFLISAGFVFFSKRRKKPLSQKHEKKVYIKKRS
ncbi:MAG: ferrous iron transport protein B [Firmicutes bacterium]|nr:ferrous iron transport protein B [Bacillota bacterium]